MNQNQNNNIDVLFYSQNNLDNTYSQVADEVLKRTNKDISKNSNYKATYQKMASIVYDKIPLNERNLMKCNAILVEKTVTYFHGKIFEKTVKGDTISTASQRPSASNQSQNSSYTMIKDNSDLKGKMDDLIAKRQTPGNIINISGINGDGNPNTYLPQPMLAPQQIIVPPSTATRNQQFQRVGDTMTPTNKPTLQQEQTDFTIKPFNLNDDLTESLYGNDSQDSPLYQNIENLQKMEGINPMTILEDYTRQRDKQNQQYLSSEKRQNITAMQIQPEQEQNIVFSRNNTDAITKIDQTQVDPMELLRFGNKLSNKYVERMEERIVNENNVQTISPDIVETNQSTLIKEQRNAQPKYIEKVHYININSVDRNWVSNPNETRYSFQVKFNQNSDYQGGASISQMYRNIISVELVSAVLPMDAYVDSFDTRIYMGLSRYPYLLLRIDELDNVFKGTNNWVDRAFSTMIFDKVFYTNTLSTDYISGVETSIVQSSPKQGFSGEYLRGFLKYNPAYFEKKKFYNNPLANLSRMTIDITDPRGNFVNNQSDVLNISNIQYTANLAAITANTTELLPTFGWPYSTQSDYKYVQITTSTYFSNRLFRIGDRILIQNFTFNSNASGVNDSNFTSFINQTQGHIIINLDIETNGATNTNNRGFLSNIYISPPGSLNTANQTVKSGTYYDNTTLDLSNVSVFGSMIDVDLQTQLLFRIVTRDPDTTGTLQPINIY
jgi:hypothetical protein